MKRAMTHFETDHIEHKIYELWSDIQYAHNHHLEAIKEYYQKVFDRILVRYLNK